MSTGIFDIIKTSQNSSEFDKFDKILESELEKNLEQKLRLVEYNKCKNCNLLMFYQNSQYICEKCGCIKTVIGGHENSDDKSSTKRRIIKDNSNSPDKILKFLNNKNEASEARGEKRIPLVILEQTAQLYNNIQKISQNTLDTSYKLSNRSSNVNDILSAILYQVCINNNYGYKKKEIADFMMLESSGFSKGDDFIKHLESRGIISLNISNDIVKSLTIRYCRNLNIDEKYINFISEIISAANNLNIGMNSISSSKVVGTIWLLIRQLSWQETMMKSVAKFSQIKIDDIEKQCDKTRRNTFISYYELIKNNERLFLEIYKKYNVPSAYINYGGEN